MPISDASRPSVAVVIPVFNAGKQLREAVASVQAQTHRCDIVIVDDGSTDPTTKDVVASLAGVATVVEQPNRGAAAARNTGIGATDATYVLPLDADDWIDATYVERAAEVLSASATAGIVYCRAARFGSVEGTWQLPDYSPDLMATDNIIFISAMFRRSDWKCVGGFDESLRDGGEDWDFWLSLIDLGREVHQIPETLFHYRITEASAGRSFRRNDLVEVYSTIFRKHQRFFVEHADALYAKRFSLEDRVAELELERAARQRWRRLAKGAMRRVRR